MEAIYESKLSYTSSNWATSMLYVMASALTLDRSCRMMCTNMHGKLYIP